jgi:hypothetical protein
MSERSSTKPRLAALQRNPSEALLSQFLSEGEDRLGKALQNPDTRPGRAAVEAQEGSNVSQMPTRAPETTATAVVQMREASPAPERTFAPQPREEVHSEQVDPIMDQASISVPEETSNSSRKHRRYGNRGTANQAVDMTLSFDPAHADRLTELAAYEMLRTKTRVSASEIARHLFDFALSHIQDNKVIPTDDGQGLHAQKIGG